MGMKTGALSNYIILSNIITSFLILLHILHLSVALQNDNSESLQSSSTLLYQSNYTSDRKDYNYILHNNKNKISKHDNAKHKDDLSRATACLTRVSAVVEAN